MNDNIILEHGVWNATGVYQLATAGTNTLRLNFTPGWPVVVLDSGSVTYTDGSWHHVAGVFDTDTDTAYIYFDGTLSNSRTETREVGDGGSKPIYIGSRGGTGNYFTGKIDDMRVYNRALSPREVAALAGGGSEQAAVTLNTSLDVDNDLFVQSGVLDVSDSNCSSASCSLNISGDWNNIDLFSSRSGEVILDGTSHTINGTTDFYNLTKNESSNDSTDEVLTFENSLIFTIRNILDFNGRDSDDRINIVSDSGGTSASLNVTGGQQVVHWADVTDSTADTHNIVCQQCVNGGGNDNGDSEPHWIFGTASSRGRIRVIQIN